MLTAKYTQNHTHVHAWLCVSTIRACIRLPLETHYVNFTRPGSSTLKLISRKGNTPVAAPDAMQVASSLAPSSPVCSSSACNCTASLSFSCIEMRWSSANHRLCQLVLRGACRPRHRLTFNRSHFQLPGVFSNTIAILDYWYEPAF